VVTSGSPGPFIKKNIALAYVPLELSEIGSIVNVLVREQPVKAQVVPVPFYKREKK
jgi:aminomethyltransferase